MPDLEAQEVRERGNEFGAVTGRPRRCGWLDLVVLRYAMMLNGIDTLVVTKLDVFDTQPEIQVCTAYTYKGNADDGNAGGRGNDCELEPEYTTLPGWSAPTSGIARREGPAGSGARLPEIYFGSNGRGNWNGFHRTGTRRDDCAAGNETGGLAVDGAYAQDKGERDPSADESASR